MTAPIFGRPGGSPAALLTELRAREIELTADGGSVRHRAPPGRMTVGLLLDLRAQEDAVLALLAAEGRPSAAHRPEAFHDPEDPKMDDATGRPATRGGVR